MNELICSVNVLYWSIMLAVGIAAIVTVRWRNRRERKAHHYLRGIK